MKIIAITTPKVSADDAYLIKALLDKGVDFIHLRKPDSTAEECRSLIKQLSREQTSRIIIHDYPELYDEFKLKGIHINKNITSLPVGYKGFKTRSCHSFDELVMYKNEYDYLFLSPIFDSISKAGYKSGFSSEDLLRASQSGIIDSKVVALGGVTFDKLDYLQSLNFGGVAMIGGLYNKNIISNLKCDSLLLWCFRGS